jgi:predicted RNA-binding protein YlqC (UPF0109 family)
VSPLGWAVVALVVLVAVAAALVVRRRRTPAGPGGLPTSVTRVLTTHAQERMAQRGITARQVEAVLAAPDRVRRDDAQDSMRFEKDLGRVLLKVWVVADPWPPVDEVVVKTTAANHVGTVTVPRKAVGRVIGRGGSTVSRIRAATGTQIDVGDGGRVVIRGDDRRSVDRARRMVEDAARGRG